MKSELNFYQVDDKIMASLAPLLLKILEEKKKAIIFCEDPEKIKLMDNSLWSFGRNKFIPHVTIFDEDYDFKRQPILISNKQENTNEAEYLIFLDEVTKDFAGGFSRIFHFFSEDDSSKAKSMAKNLGEISKKTNAYKREDGKWVKLSF